MSYKVFSRNVWTRQIGWPDGYKPLAVSVDRCRKLYTADTIEDARAYCAERNEKWRKHTERVRLGTATATQIRVYYESPRFEFTEE